MTTKLTKKQEIVYGILLSTIYPLSAQDIFDKLEPAEQGIFRKKTEVGCVLAELQTKGFVEHTKTDYDKSNQAVFYWELIKSIKFAEEPEKYEEPEADTEQDNEDPMFNIDRALNFIRETIKFSMEIQVPKVKKKVDKLTYLATLGELLDGLGAPINNEKLKEIAGDIYRMEDDDD